MKSSEQINELAAALALAQLEVRNAVPNAENPHFRSSYADLEAVKAACLPYLNAHGISVVQSPVVAEGGRVGVVTRLLHKSGQWMEGEFAMPSVKQDPQGYGSALTYARRYTLAAFAGVATGEDDDGEGAHGRNGKKDDKQSKPASKPAEPQKPEPKPHASVMALGDGETCTITRTLAYYHAAKAGKKLGTVEFKDDPTVYAIDPAKCAGKTGEELTVTVTAHAITCKDACWYEVTEIVPF